MFRPNYFFGYGLYVGDVGNLPPPLPPVSGDFLLLSGGNFLLLDSTNFLLL
jgi:hypothetical protein